MQSLQMIPSSLVLENYPKLVKRGGWGNHVRGVLFVIGVSYFL